MWHSISLNMNYVNKIKSNSRSLGKWLKLPENITSMKKALNIPVALVDVFERSSESDLIFEDVITGKEYITVHANPIKAIIRSYNPNLRMIPFEIELDTLGHPLPGSSMELLHDVYAEVKKGKIRGANCSIANIFYIKNILKALDLDYPWAFDLTKGGMANLPPFFKRQIRGEIFRANAKSEKVLKFWENLSELREEISILEKIAKKNKVCVVSGNYDEPYKVNTNIFAKGVRVIGALDAKGNNLHPYTYATKRVCGDFNFYISSQGKLKAKLSNELTKNCCSCFANSYAFALSFPGARTPKNIARFNKIKTKLRDNGQILV